MTALTRRIALVGCGKAKAPQATEARWLYTGPLFRAALNAAEAEFGDDVWILSAQHGLVDLDEVLEPYDVALDDCDATYLADWGHDVIRNLHDDDRNTPAHLTVYAGHAYAEALRPHLPAGWTLEEPMAGLGQGERLAWLKRRLAHVSRTASDNANPISARPSAAATESTMSATRLTPEQREQSFTKALQLEQAQEDLRVMKERFLAVWENRRAELAAQHTLYWKAATTGKNPFPPAQADLPLGEPAPKEALAAEPRQAPPAEEAQPGPAPKKRGRPPKKRDTSEVKGEKRVEPSESGRTVAEAQSPVVPAEDDLVPPPAVPCCTCGGSLSDHDGSMGRCRATHGGVKCRCKAFQLHKVWDWVLTWGEESGLRVFWLNRQGAADAAAHGPLRVERGTIVRHVLPVDVLALARKSGVWPENDGVGVPLRVLEVVERVLSSQLPRDSETSATASPTTEPSPRERYAAATRERYPHFTEDEVCRHVENHLLQDGTPVPVPPEFSGLKATVLLDAHLGPRKPRYEYRDELDLTGTESACEKCGTRKDPRARLTFSRHYRPRGVKTWRPDKDSRCGAIHFSLWRCARCCSPEVLTGERLDRQDRAYDMPPAQEADSPEREPAPASSFTDSQLGDWSVELPERHEGGSIIRLWLVNSTTSERVPCTWWSGTGTLKPTHRLSGKAEGEALSEELRVKAWWTQHQDSVVAHVAESCRQGKVPGLCLYLSDEVVTVSSRYALSGGWWLEAQEVLGDEKGPWFRFSGPSGRSDMREMTAYVRLHDGRLVNTARELDFWWSHRSSPVPEAESFIARGFVFEAMP